MKNYLYKYEIEDRELIEVSIEEYTSYEQEMYEYIAMLSTAIEEARCGWNEVKYKVMQSKYGHYEHFMVLCVEGREERWIPITGNSKGCSFSILGENIW